MVYTESACIFPGNTYTCLAATLLQIQALLLCQTYRKSKAKLSTHLHQSTSIAKGSSSHNYLTDYINRILDRESFEEANDTKLCKFYSYQKIRESYIGKERKPYEYMRTAGADECKPVLHLQGLIKNGNAKYKKHRTYVDNCSTVLPLMKDA